MKNEVKKIEIETVLRLADRIEEDMLNGNWNNDYNELVGIIVNADGEWHEMSDSGDIQVKKYTRNGGECLKAVVTPGNLGWNRTEYTATYVRLTPTDKGAWAIQTKNKERI